MKKLNIKNNNKIYKNKKNKLKILHKKEIDIYKINNYKIKKKNFQNI